ncbi:uncharacterized protein N7498_002667 [Penicillium cinerascens]|uniref:Fringe-like glycosyltransferase domain-containing protein n=1 Tax=Penicillium cinerascens TaxID=70096 RepID=A0A9W9TC59_9EURO|nr:uncharacterized protein N7498_002667 [Penicillium cinerascens]KAJ5216260.1 hypothetical protein N7498_002667 [Penicillium cinerascens]
MLFQNRERSIPASWAWKKMMRFAMIIVAVTGFAALLWPSPPHRAAMHAYSNVTISSDVRCDLDPEMLYRIGVRKLVAYTRREMVVDVVMDPLPVRQSVDQPLLDVKWKPSVSSEVEPGQSPDGCTIPMPMQVQVVQPPKMAVAPHIDFGVATSIGRLNESLDQFAHWAGYTRTRIFALIEPDETGEGISYVKTKAENLGINLFITESEDDYLHRYFALIPLMKEHMREQTQWACIIDDDTFFLSMSALVDALAEYDHTKPMYIGGLSEGTPQIAVFGIIAFGGAGVFLSRPLLSELAAVYDECEQMTYTGDRRIANCVYQYTTTRMTIDHRLHQLDLMKDASGFFESGREPPLSVHHWKSWFQADMPKLSVISELCGDTCLLRQWQFADGWMLTNGFSVIKYGFPPGPGDLSMEMTWEPHNGAVEESYLHELGPLRRKDEMKESFLLEDAVMEENGRVRQWYVKRDSTLGDEVLELSWRKR